MSYDTNVYYNPEKYDLKQIAQIDFSDGCYQFDYLVVWQHTLTGNLYYAEDSGCSCPSPFESIGMPELTRVQDAMEIVSRMEARNGSAEDAYYDEDHRRVSHEIADFKAKINRGEFG